MRLEGRLRQHEWIKRRWWDLLFYAILEDEFRARRGQ
jgi:RimJ/RimL family protein N-acetyltransferase